MNQAFYFISSPSLYAARLAESSLEALSRRAVPQRVGLKFHVESSSMRLLAKLRSRAADALVIDARAEEGPLEQSPALCLLDELFGMGKLGGPIGREQLWLGDAPNERGARLAFEAGSLPNNGPTAGPATAGTLAQTGGRVAR